MMNKLTLSYETTLPSHLYRRLFSIQRFYVNNLIREFWRREWIERLYVSQNVWKMLDKVSERPPHIPSRVWRNICAEAGSVLRASYKRMILTEELLRKKELIDTPSWKVAEKLKTKRLFIENIQAQIKNFRKKKGILPKDFFELRYLFSSWFYRKVVERLRQKAFVSCGQPEGLDPVIINFARGI